MFKGTRNAIANYSDLYIELQNRFRDKLSYSKAADD